MYLILYQIQHVAFYKHNTLYFNKKGTMNKPISYKMEYI